MGIVGAGKTTVGSRLAEQLGWQFADADSFHSAESIDKIRRGIPLTDTDRAPWLRAMRDAIQAWTHNDQDVVLACSALKRSYRDELRADPVRFVYLKGNEELILGRLRSRHGHFADQKILESQFATLEEPASDESDVTTVGIDGTPAEIAKKIIAELKLAA
jgi:gluconokinase